MRQQVLEFLPTCKRVVPFKACCGCIQDIQKLDAYRMSPGKLHDQTNSVIDILQNMQRHVAPRVGAVGNDALLQGVLVKLPNFLTTEVAGKKSFGKDALTSLFKAVSKRMEADKPTCTFVRWRLSRPGLPVVVDGPGAEELGWLGGQRVADEGPAEGCEQHVIECVLIGKLVEWRCLLLVVGRCCFGWQEEGL